MIQGFSNYYTFHIGIKRNNDTVLDVTLGANGNQDEIDKTKKTMQRLLNSYMPSFKKTDLKTETIPTAPKFILEDQASVGPTDQPEDTPPPEIGAEQAETQAQKASPDEEPEGARGLVHLRCGGCGGQITAFLYMKRREFICRCGYSVDLTKPMAKFKYICPYCEAERWGLTNLEDPTISVKCKCGRMVDMQWVPKAKEYQN